MERAVLEPLGKGEGAFILTSSLVKDNSMGPLESLTHDSGITEITVD